MIKRIGLFFVTNLLVVLTISFVTQALGLRPYLSANGLDPVALFVLCAVYGTVGSFISLQMSRMMAKMWLGVKVIDPTKPQDREQAWLVETVASLSQKAGLRVVPEVGVYDSPEVNAFATGPSRDRALIAVSTGIVERMDREALEGVLGHEMAHVANGDMVTMALLQGIANVFVMFFARVATFAVDSFLRSRDDDGHGGLGWIGQWIMISLFETVFMLLAAPIVYWFSRQREFRADQGSAQYLGRRPMIKALEALQGAASDVDDRQPALAMMKINGRATGVLAKLFSSHPSLEERIARLQAAV